MYRKKNRENKEVKVTKPIKQYQQELVKYTTTNREGYREYKSDPRVCQNCPCRHE